MPFISITVSFDINNSQQAHISKECLRIMQETLGKNRDLTAITITRLPAQSWYIGEKSLEKSHTNSVFINVKISKNSNTELEKAQAINEFYELFDATTGPISEISYVVIDELPLGDWGYGGETQSTRRVKRTESGSIDTEHHLKIGLSERSAYFLSIYRKFENLLRKPLTSKNTQDQKSLQA